MEHMPIPEAGQVSGLKKEMPSFGAVLGELKKQGGLFEQWGDALGEPHRETTINRPRHLMGRQEKMMADEEKKTHEGKQFDPTGEQKEKVIAAMDQWIGEWAKQRAVSKDVVFDLWVSILNNLQSLGRPRLHAALKAAIDRHFLE
ncbi:MAG: hypothetical protein ACYC44_05285 [Patescibacteria group bacterium]